MINAKRTSDEMMGRSTDPTVIAALATAPGHAALALLRISGDLAERVLARCFRPYKRFPAVQEMAPYTLAVGLLGRPQKTAEDPAFEPLDEVVLSCYRAPHSYTGEDLFEISCHGGPAVQKAVFEAVLAAGARPAEPGEFTRRAFLNGKLDLTRAEAVMDLIEAESRAQETLALEHLRGRLGRIMLRLEQAAYDLLGRLELMLEFPDEEDDLQHRALFLEELTALQAELRELVVHYSLGQNLREGYRIALAGAPNVGKSSLMNCLLAEDRAIVSDEAGTTRDLLEGTFELQGVRCRLFDCAGLRETGNRVEQEGIRRARQALADADLILYLYESESPAARQDRLEIARLLEQGKRVWIVLAKRDLLDSFAVDAALAKLAQLFPNCPRLTWSAKDPAALAALREALQAALPGLQPERPVLLANLRQKALVERALSALEEAAEAFQAGLPYDVLASTLRRVPEALAELSGTAVNERLVDSIFSRFCVGK